MAYPDTDLRNDTLDPLYGGRPALEWGGLAWQWVNALLRVLSEAHLLYNRSSFHTIAPVTDQYLVPGDVAVMDLLAVTGTSGPKVRKAIAGDAAVPDTSKVIGVCVVGAAVGKRAVLAVGGVVPRTLVGFAALTGGVELSVDFTSGRLKVASGGEVVVAYGDPAGNVLLALGT